jgi:Rrf2 family nitric oxide-sensitive transcriptional repressor
VRLTTFTDYSLRVLMYLAASPEKRATIAEVSEAFGISEHHVVKVVHFLGKEGFLLNTRGRGGGLELARAPSAINVGHVVRLAEGGDHAAECFERGSNACVVIKACRLRGVLEEALGNFYATLERYTLEDLRMQRKVQWLNA